MARTDIAVLTQHALNCYRSGAAVIISASDGSPLHGLETFTKGDQGEHLCVSFPDVDAAAFQAANVGDALEDARLMYLTRWKQRRQTASK
jgi:hypothetical protein